MSKTSLVIGLTGNIATGKTAVLAYLASKGAHVIDADKLGHKVMEPGGPAYQATVDEFGRRILARDGTIDRQVLGEIVFANAAALGRLEEIVHPAVFAAMRQDIGRARSGVVVVEAVKLLEAGLMVTLCDEVWVVTASPEAQLHRLMHKRGMDKAQAQQRMGMQSPQAVKVYQADRVISNDGTLEDLHAQLDRVWHDLELRYPEALANLMSIAGGALPE